MSTILLSCYRCDPEGVSEAYSGYKWAEALCARNRVVVCVPGYSADRVRDALERSGAKDYDVLAVPVPNLDASLGALGRAVKPGFALYEQRLKRILRSSSVLEDVDVIWHRTPMSFRNRTSLHTLGKPFVIGPVGGGLRVPGELRGYFGTNVVGSVVGSVDDVLLRSAWWMGPFDAAERVIAACDYVSDVLPERLRPKTVTILDTAVDGVTSRRGREIRSSDSAFTVLFVGRLVRYKGPMLALDAFREFLQSLGRPGGVRLVFVGDGPEQEALRRAAVEHGIARHVEFRGRLPKPDTLACYDEADVFLFPSVTEASGNVYLEAMAAGLPSVIVDNGGGHFITSAGCAMRVGLAPEAELVRGLAQGVSRLYADPGLRQRMGEAARERICTHFTWQRIGEQAQSVLLDALGTDRAGRLPDEQDYA